MTTCTVTGKKSQSGNKVSHANNKVKRQFSLNLKNHRYQYENRVIKLRLSAAGIRLIDKLGIDAALKLKKKLK